ncbi:hypothetical protein CTI12_AA292790 [Artemisia annua]|uniref:Uncharacterized protein n=1 Tax=Artemisia annua TaxID=35608 RepID=A0A2U1N8M1_ARTAN|nr:hypothetical protein CTI12_AA292790 [Artemisia annua]
MVKFDTSSLHKNFSQKTTTYLVSQEDNEPAVAVESDFWLLVLLGLLRGRGCGSSQNSSFVSSRSAPSSSAVRYRLPAKTFYIGCHLEVCFKTSHALK